MSVHAYLSWRSAAVGILLLCAPLQNATEPETREKPTAEQALATIGYLYEKESKKSDLTTLHASLRSFITRIVELADRSGGGDPYPDLMQLHSALDHEFADIQVELLLEALIDAAHTIKNGACALCSPDEVQELNEELQRWCEWASGLVHERKRS
ncbi:MAG: hypothetical protein M1549_02370 [Candidatus Dependentiae bacterium]|nr:hypothetical protein [Candidatus Dependentiae bacterium]